MPLLAYNKTIAPLALAAGSPIVTLPASASVGQRGPAVNVTAELKALSAPNYALLQAQVIAGSVEFAWTSDKEYLTSGLDVISNVVEIAEENIGVYVDPAGNDGNAGTQSSPVLTFKQAWRMTAGIARKNRRINLAAGSYSDSANAGSPASKYGIDLATGPDSEPLTLVGGTPTDQLGTLSISSLGQANGRVFNAAVHAPQVGAFLRFTSGAANGQRRIIVKDDGTTFTLNRSPSVAPSVNDTFVVERPSTIITLNSPTFFNGPGLLSMKDIKFIVNTGAGGFLLFSDSIAVVSTEGCEFELNTNQLVQLRYSNYYSQSNDFQNNPPNPFDRVLRLSCGSYFHGATPGNGANIQVIFGSTLGRNNFGGGFFKDINIGILDSSTLNMQVAGAVFDNCVVTGDNNSFITLAGNDVNNKVLLQNGARLAINGTLLASQVDISGSTADAILVNNNGRVRLDVVTGSSNTGSGVKLLNGSHAQITANTLVTGTAGDMNVGGRTITYASTALLPVYCDDAGNTIQRGDVTVTSNPVIPKIVATQTSLYTASFADVVPVNPTGGAFAVNLPSIVASSAGQMIRIKNVSGSTNAVTLTAAGGNTVDGSATLVMNTALKAIDLVSDGATNWMVIGSF